VRYINQEYGKEEERKRERKKERKTQRLKVIERGEEEILDTIIR
jgi:hypothetical protein